MSTARRRESRPELAETATKPQDCIYKSPGNVRFHVRTMNAAIDTSRAAFSSDWKMILSDFDL